MRANCINNLHTITGAAYLAWVLNQAQLNQCWPPWQCPTISWHLNTFVQDLHCTCDESQFGQLCITPGA